MRTLIAVYALLATLIITSCGGGDTGQRFAVKGKALGIMNDVVIVSDAALWDGPIGDTIDRYFEGFYPLTPSPEPIFDLRHFTIEDIELEPLRKELRTYILVADLSDDASTTTQVVKKDLGTERVQRALTEEGFFTSVGKDKWATGQLLIYIFAKNADKLAEAIRESSDGVSARINEFDSYQLNQLTYGKGENRGLATSLESRFAGANITFPLDYGKVLDAPEQNNLYWMRKNISYKIGRDANPGYINIAVSIHDYTGPEMLEKEAVKSRFNSFGQNVSSDEPNTYAIINDVDLPILEYDREVSGNYTKEYRGIWEMENDFMGGPFQSYALVNTTTNKLLSVDAFIYAPGKNKRDLMQQVDAIVNRIKW